MNKLLIATIIVFASYAFTVVAIGLVIRKMFIEAAVVYGIGWIVAFFIGGA